MRTILVLAVLLLIVTPALADGAIFEACVNRGNGVMRLVDATTACHANESRIQWNQAGLQGPPGPAGPQGPAGNAAGGPPYVYVCTPINYHNAGTTTEYLFVYNGSESTANVAVNPLNKNGTNLAGATIAVSPGTIPPGDPLPLYPGQTGTSTVPLAPANTMILNWYTAQGSLDTDLGIAITMRVTSDQPVVVATNTIWSGFNVVPCTLLPQ